MTHIKNLRPIKTIEGFIGLIEMENQAALNLHHLQIFSSNVYVFLYEEK